MPNGSGEGGGEGPRPVTGTLIRPGVEPLRATLVRPPRPKLGGQLADSFSAAFHSPGLLALLTAATAVARVGWIASAVVAARAFPDDLGLLVPATGMAATAALLSGLARLVVWAGGGPRIAARIRGESLESPPTSSFGAGVARAMSGMVSLGLLRIGAWLALEAAGWMMLVATLITLVVAPSNVGWWAPAWMLKVGADVLLGLLSWVALARIGALGEGALAALSQGLRQVLARPGPHLLGWLAANASLSTLGGGGVALLGAMAALQGGAVWAAVALGVVVSFLHAAVALVAFSWFVSLAVVRTPAAS